MNCFKLLGKPCQCKDVDTVNKNSNKLDLKAILNAIDSQNLGYYASLTEDERKQYVPLVLMRYMSSLPDQNPNACYAALAVNDLVNIGFWNLSRHPELQHMLLCLSGVGGRNFRPWLPTDRKKKSGKVASWLMELFPHLDDEEISLIRSQHDLASWTKFVNSSGLTEKESADIIGAWKKEE
jgi:hypothetical protein